MSGLSSSISLSSATIAAAGTPYTVTNANAAITFGTTSPALTIPAAGVWMLQSGVVVNYVAATFAAVRGLTLKYVRTNNTPGDLTNGSITLSTQIITTLSFSMGEQTLPTLIYTTVNNNDAITLQAGLDVAPTAGSLQVIAAWVTAVKIA